MSKTRRAEAEELTVEKTLHDPAEPPSLVTFEMTSTGDVPMMFRLVDALPTDVPATTVGFHPEYKFDNWTLHETGEMEFADVIAPGESLLTFYYLQEDLTAYESAFDEPRLTDVTPTTPDALEDDQPPTLRSTSASVIAKDPVVDGPLPEQLRLTSADEASSAPELEDSPQSSDSTADAASLADLREEISRNDAVDDPGPSGSDLATETVFAELQAEFDQREYEEFGNEVEQYYPSDVGFDELLDQTEVSAVETQRDPGEGAPPSAATGDETSLANQIEDTSAADHAADSEHAESVLSALLRELDEYEFSEEERAALAEQFGLTTPRHTSVKVRHLQSEIADLSAYIDALEEFLDDNGTAAELLGTLEDDLERAQTRLDELETTVEDTTAQQSALADRIDTLEQDVNTAEEVREDLTDVQEQVADNSRRLDRMEEKLTQLVNQMNTTIKSLEDSLSAQSDRVSSLEKTVARIEDRYKRICSILGSAAQTLTGVPDGESDE